MQPTLIITRPAPDGARFAAAFSDVNVILSPLQKIVPISTDCDAKGLIFTSTNGVTQATRLGLSCGPAWCVGDRTAQVANDAGFSAISANGNVEDLLRLILADPPEIPIAHIRGREARGDLTPRLRAAGVACSDCIAYEQMPLPLTENAHAAIKGAERVIIPLFSPRAAHLLLDQLNLPAGIILIAISQTVAGALGDRPVMVANRPDGAAMEQAVKQVLATM